MVTVGGDELLLRYFGEKRQIMVDLGERIPMVVAMLVVDSR